MNRTQKVSLRTFSLCLSLFVGWNIYARLVVPSGAFAWDEAAHALRGLIIARDLKEFDWLGFLYDSYRQVYWPPVHSWFAGIAFLIGGHSAVTARTVSLISFVIAAAVIYAAALQLANRNSELAAIAAGALFITSPALSGFAAQSMLEIPGLLALILAFLVYFTLTNGPTRSPRAFVLLGLAVSVTYFVKTNYAVLLCLAILTNSLIEAEFRLHRLLTLANFYTVLPLLIVLSIWFAYPPKVTETWNSLVNQPFGVMDRFSAAGFFFYPLAFFRISGSVCIAALLLTSLIIGLRFRRDKNVRFLIVLVLIQIGIGQIHQTKVDRHIFPIMPALFLLAGYVLAKWWDSRHPAKKGRHSGCQGSSPQFLLLFP